MMGLHPGLALGAASGLAVTACVGGLVALSCLGLSVPGRGRSAGQGLGLRGARLAPVSDSVRGTIR